MGYITVSIGLQRGAVAVEAHKAEWEAAAKKTIELLKSILKMMPLIFAMWEAQPLKAFAPSRLLI